MSSLNCDAEKQDGDFKVRTVTKFGEITPRMARAFLDEALRPEPAFIRAFRETKDEQPQKNEERAAEGSPGEAGRDESLRGEMWGDAAAAGVVMEGKEIFMDKLIEEASHSIARQHAELIDSSVFSFLAEKFPEGLSINELRKRGKFVVRARHTGMPEHQFWFDEKPVLQFQQGLIGGEWKAWCEKL